MSKKHSSEIQRPARPEGRSVLSACTVLILSGFVLGMSIGVELAPEFQLMICIAGLTGLVAYLGLDHLAHLRRIRAERQEQEYFQDRLVRHIDASSSGVIDHEDLMELSREATSTTELDSLLPVGSEA
jgi:hypothetical protein